MISGVLLLVVAGLVQGSSGWPIKLMKRWQYEHWAFVAMTVALVVIPWTATLMVCPNALEAYRTMPTMVLENHRRFVPGYNEEADRQWAKEAIPVGHAGTPLDIAKLAIFLCSDDAEYMVGQTIVADGGTVSLMSLISDFRNKSSSRYGLGYLPGV